jgi:hypothetical protein
MENSDILARVKSDLRKGIEVIIGVSSRFYSGNIAREFRRIVEMCPQFSEILSPMIADTTQEFDCAGDIYFVMGDGVVSGKVIFVNNFVDEYKPAVRFTISIETFDSFCDAMIDVVIFMTDNGDTCLSEL